jgi:hypothetical protein
MQNEHAILAESARLAVAFMTWAMSTLSSGSPSGAL